MSNSAGNKIPFVIPWLCLSADEALLITLLAGTCETEAGTITNSPSDASGMLKKVGHCLLLHSHTRSKAGRQKKIICMLEEVICCMFALKNPSPVPASSLLSDMPADFTGITLTAQDVAQLHLLSSLAYHLPGYWVTNVSFLASRS